MEEIEKKKFKFQARMVDDDLLMYVDVPLDNKDHSHKDIARIVDGSMIISVC